MQTLNTKREDFVLFVFRKNLAGSVTIQLNSHIDSSSLLHIAFEHTHTFQNKHTNFSFYIIVTNWNKSRKCAKTQTTFNYLWTLLEKPGLYH